MNAGQPYYKDDNVTLYHGDCLEVLAGLPDATVDSVVTDPPYGLEFMGKDWDRPWAVSPTRPTGFVRSKNTLTLPSFNDNRNANCRACKGRQRGKQRCKCAAPQWDRDPASDMRQFGQWCELWARECLRVLKPGGHLLTFGGTRTWHRLACAVEDAGFEIRDSIAWLYGSGFPKSMDVSKAIDKAAGAKREVIGSKRLGGNALVPTSKKGGTYGVNVGTAPAGDVPITAPATPDAERWQGWGTALKPAFEPVVVARKPLSGTVAGNVLAHGTGALNIDATRVATSDTWSATGRCSPPSTVLKGGASGALNSSVSDSHPAGRWPANALLDPHAAEEVERQSGADSGASRFFPIFRYNPKAPADERPSANGIAHPTVKPLDLIRWLVRLVTPPGGTVLEPFAGSGTTAEACIHEHMQCIAIEREADYLPLIVARLSKPMEIGFDFEAPTVGEAQ